MNLEYQWLCSQKVYKASKVVSDVADLEKGEFQEIPDDNVKNPKRDLLMGKVYYDLIENEMNWPKKMLRLFD